MWISVRIPSGICSIRIHGVLVVFARSRRGKVGSGEHAPRFSAGKDTLPPDAFGIRGNPDLGDTIARLQAYEAAGADVLYAPGLRTTDDIEIGILSP